ncbi:MAG: TIGR01906 family membrane protein [Candidatus Cryosericum sp.]
MFPLVIAFTVTATVTVLLVPFSLLVNFMPLQRLLLFLVGTTGGPAPRFTPAEASSRTASVLKYLAFRTPLPGDGFYSSTEIAHMVDVQRIFQAVYLTAIVSCLLTLLLGVFLRRRQMDRKRAARTVGVTVLSLIALLGTASATVGFDAIFIAFHQLAFTNDFWLLPADSGLIRLFPEQYFMSYFFIALGTSAALAIALIVLSRREHTRSL